MKRKYIRPSELLQRQRQTGESYWDMIGQPLQTPLQDHETSDEDYYNLMERIAKAKAKTWGEDTNDALTQMLNDNTYNYRGWYDNNPVEAERMAEGDPAAHWPDTYKTAMHPTFSTESIYSGKQSEYNPRAITGGKWGQLNGRNTFTPSFGQYQYWGPLELQNYFKKVEPNVILLPYSNSFKYGKDTLE